MKAKSDCLFEIEWQGFHSACWIWKRALRNGYGCLGIGGRAKNGGRLVYAHRHLYEMVNGPIPTGLHIDHLCRNRACVRPDHLEPVTCAQNLRRGKGTKLTQIQVDEIRRRRASGEKGVRLAEEFGIDKFYLYLICKGSFWK
jgi:hypothetical protein